MAIFWVSHVMHHFLKLFKTDKALFAMLNFFKKNKSLRLGLALQTHAWAIALLGQALGLLFFFTFLFVKKIMHYLCIFV